MPDRVSSKSYQPRNSSERFHAELRQLAAHFFGQRAKIRDDHFRLACKTHAQSFVLRGDADRDRC